MDITPLSPVELSPVAGGDRYILARVIDIETTDSDLETSEVIEVGWVDVWFPLQGGKPFMSKPFQTFVRPTKPITVEAMAIHHITNEDAANGLPQEELKALFIRDRPDCFVAHNANFERAFLDTDGTPWLCTYKSALRVYPDSPRHTNQVLRYQLGINCDPVLAQPPHRAAPDAYVTAFILMKLAETVSIEQMIEWTSMPAKFPRVMFGKHKGSEWSDVPDSYLRWVINDGKFDEDVVWNVRTEQERRRSLIASAPTDEHLPPLQAYSFEETCTPV